jgi:hypothetical protein
VSLVYRMILRSDKTFFTIAPIVISTTLRKYTEERAVL